MADIARMDYRIKLSIIGEKRGLIIEYRLNFKPTIWKGLGGAETPWFNKIRNRTENFSSFFLIGCGSNGECS